MELASRQLAESSLYEFVKQAWHVIEPGKAFVDNWHIRLICELLERVYRREVRRAIINIPPRCMKSTIVSVIFPVWCWVQNQTTQFLSISHNATLSTRDALKSRRLIQSPWFQARWGRLFTLTGDQNQKTRYENNKRGYRIAMGMTSGITGEGGDIILLDDPHDRDSAHSELERTSALTTYDEAVSTRLNSPATGAIVVIMQRLHEMDLTGHLLAGQEKWEHLCLPMESEQDRKHPSDPRTREGEMLWPDHFTPKVVQELKARLGSYGAAGQLQQRPAPKGGGIWKDTYLKDCRIDGARIIVGETIRMADLHVFNVADLAYSSKQSADYTVIGTFGGDMATGKLFMLDMFRSRIDLMATVQGAEHRHYLKRQREANNAAYTVVERVSYSLNIIEYARREGEPIREVEADKDKVSRAYAALPLCEAGDFYVPHAAAWYHVLWSELSAFPNGEHDDAADVVAYGISHWRDMLTNGRAQDMAHSAMAEVFGD